MPLSESAKSLSEAAASLLDVPYSPHVPTARQAMFLLDFSRETLFGGAAGGGKSDAILMAALQFVGTPGYSAICFRKTYQDLALPGALMDRAHTWLANTPARWRADEHTWIFPSGATITFGYLDREADKYRYQGSEYQFIGFDELTQFSEAAYRYLFSRLRRPTRRAGSNAALGGVPLRMRAASNPGGVGHEWVHRRFFMDGQRMGRNFIPSKLSDNPHLDQNEYTLSLNELDPVTRAQLLHGDWEIRPQGNVLQREWFPVVDTAPGDCTWVRYWDLAGSDAEDARDPDWTAGLLLGRSRATRRLYIADVQRFRSRAQGNEVRVRQTAASDSRSTAIWIEQEPGSAGKSIIDHYRRNVLDGYSVSGHRSTGDKLTRSGPVASQAEAGNIALVSGPWITTFLDEIGAFPHSPHDDQVDALCGAYEKLGITAQIPIAGPRSLIRSSKGWHT